MTKNDEPMQIFVKSFDGKTITVEVFPTTTIQQVKQMVADKSFGISIPTDYFFLQHRGTALRTDQTISSCRAIKKESTLFASVRSGTKDFNYFAGFKEGIPTDLSRAPLAIQNDGLMLRYHAPTLSDNEYIARIACAQNWKAVEFCSERLRGNERFMTFVAERENAQHSYSSYGPISFFCPNGPHNDMLKFFVDKNVKAGRHSLVYKNKTALAYAWERADELSHSEEFAILGEGEEYVPGKSAHHLVELLCFRRSNDC